MSGTSPWLILSAMPSTTAVLPTPGSPTQMGLFFLRRPRMSIIWRISESLPKTGSISPRAAFSVKSVQKRVEERPHLGSTLGAFRAFFRRLGSVHFRGALRYVPEIAREGVTAD
jgi:hypothetical protein